MDKFFNSDNGVMRALSKIFDMGLLTLIYLVFCIPVVTAGAATTSLYYVSAKVLRHNRSYVWREFWSSFKTNFLQSTIVWVITAVITVLLIFNMQIVGANADSAKSGYLVGAYLAMLFVLLCINCYVYPIISRFGTGLSQILRLSLYCAFRHFLHTIMMVAILAAMVALIYLGMITNIILIFIFAPGLAGFAYTFPMEHILKKYMPKEEPKYTEDGEEIVAWYNE